MDDAVILQGDETEGLKQSETVGQGSILRVYLVELWLWEKAAVGCELWKSCCGL